MSITVLLVAAALLLPAADGKVRTSPSMTSSTVSPVPVLVKSVSTELPPTGFIDGPGPLDEARKVAERYLKALAGEGSELAGSFLLGGLTLTAQDFSIPNWRIVSREEPRIEERLVADAVRMLWALDGAAAESLKNIVVAEGESLSLTQEQAVQLLGPTREMAVQLQERFPLFSFVARNGKDIFWHPENPCRKEVRKLGQDGSYRLTLHRFTIEERENGARTRLWPLRVLRMTTNNYDSGWKILPASDWDPSY